MKTKFKVIKSDNIEFPLNVQVWNIDESGNEVYSGNGRFCKNQNEVDNYITQYV